jgi:hypothetical protein
MAFTGNFMCTSFKQEVLQGIHNFTTSTGDTFKLALYTNTAAFDCVHNCLHGDQRSCELRFICGWRRFIGKRNPNNFGYNSICDFDDLAFTSATITARGALIYNSSAAGDPTVAVLDFGSDKTSTTGTFTIQFPTADASNAIIRIA